MLAGLTALDGRLPWNLGCSFRFWFLVDWFSRWVVLCGVSCMVGLFVGLLVCCSCLVGFVVISVLVFVLVVVYWLFLRVVWNCFLRLCRLGLVLRG